MVSIDGRVSNCAVCDSANASFVAGCAEGYGWCNFECVRLEDGENQTGCSAISNTCGMVWVNADNDDDFGVSPYDSVRLVEHIADLAIACVGGNSLECYIARVWKPGRNTSPLLRVPVNEQCLLNLLFSCH